MSCGAPQKGRNAFHFLDAFRSFDKRHIRARLNLQARAVDRSLKAELGASIGPRNNQKILAPAGVQAAFIFAVISPAAITCLPLKWPQRFGKT